jgi:hypothetical protein
LFSLACAADGRVLSNLHSKKIAIRVGSLRLIAKSWFLEIVQKGIFKSAQSKIVRWKSLRTEIIEPS